MTADITGTSTRKADDLLKALGCDLGLSKSTDDQASYFDDRRRSAPPTLVGCPMQPAVQVEVPSNRKQLRSYLSGA